MNLDCTNYLYVSTVPESCSIRHPFSLNVEAVGNVSELAGTASVFPRPRPRPIFSSQTTARRCAVYDMTALPHPPASAQSCVVASVRNFGHFDSSTSRTWTLLMPSEASQSFSSLEKQLPHLYVQFCIHVFCTYNKCFIWRHIRCVARGKTTHPQ